MAHYFGPCIPLTSGLVFGIYVTSQFGSEMLYGFQVRFNVTLWTHLQHIKEMCDEVHLAIKH